MIPQRLEFGNPEHIQLRRDYELKEVARILIEENGDDLIERHLKDHDSECGECGHESHHDGEDARIEIKKVRDGKALLHIFCTAGGCYESVEITVDIETQKEIKDLDGQLKVFE